MVRNKLLETLAAFSHEQTMSIVFYSFLLVTTAGQIQEHLGMIGILLYFAIAIIGLVAFYPPVVARFARLKKHIPYLIPLATVGIMSLSFLAFLLFMPRNLTDRYDALDKAGRALAQLKYPYYDRTYLNLPISPLPGAVFLALPFTLLYTSSLQNFFWYPLFGWVLSRYVKNNVYTFAFLMIPFIFAPVVPLQLLTGDDLLTNGIYIALAVLFLLQSHRGHNGLAEWISSMCLGITFSSRVNFLFIVPLVMMALSAEIGWRSTIIKIFLVLMVASMITLPFYFYDPAGFSPLHTMRNQTLDLKAHISHRSNFGLFITVAITIWLTLRSDNADWATLFRNCAIVLLIPYLDLQIRASLAVGSLYLYPFGSSNYGLFALPFAILAYSFWKLKKKLPYLPEFSNKPDQ